MGRICLGKLGTSGCSPAEAPAGRRLVYAMLQRETTGMALPDAVFLLPALAPVPGDCARAGAVERRRPIRVPLRDLLEGLPERPS